MYFDNNVHGALNGGANPPHSFKILFFIIYLFRGNIMVETYKYKSKFATAISFIAMFIAYLGKDGLAQIIPPDYAWLIPPIVGIAAYIVTQGTENIRVNRAEQMVHEQYSETVPEETDDIIVDPTISEEDEISDDVVVGDEDGC